LMNIMQQIASSVGAAVMSVILSNETRGVRTLSGTAHGFAVTFTVALVLVVVTLVPVLLLPRRRVVPAVEDEDAPATEHVAAFPL